MKLSFCWFILSRLDFDGFVGFTVKKMWLPLIIKFAFIVFDKSGSTVVVVIVWWLVDGRVQRTDQLLCLFVSRSSAGRIAYYYYCFPRGLRRRYVLNVWRRRATKVPRETRARTTDRTIIFRNPSGTFYSDRERFFFLLQ
jgi:hypothetical protein